MTIDELIAALEKAEGPSVELDKRVFALINGREWYRSTFEQYEPSEPLPKYSASLDAALTLVPRGMEWSLTTLYGEATAEVGLNNTTGMHSTGRRKDGNVAIVLCIAALKVRRNA